VASRSDTGPSLAGRSIAPCCRNPHRGRPRHTRATRVGQVNLPHRGEQCSVPDRRGVSSHADQKNRPPGPAA